MIIDAKTRNALVQTFKELGEITKACAEEINKQLEELYEPGSGSSCYMRTRTRTITGSVYMDCQRPGKSVEKLSKL